jgi:protein arginine kinase activator
MLCDNCHQNEATVHIQEIAGKKRRAVHLCPACAAEKGMSMSGELAAGLDIPGLLMSLAKQALPGAVADGAVSTARAGGKGFRGHCPACGLTADDFRKHGRLGCPECYQALAPLLAPMLAGMHRGPAHVGKRPAGEPSAPPAAAAPPPVPAAVPAAPTPPSLASLQAALARAIGKEDYEAAAGLRDEIRKLEADAGQEKHPE